MFSLKSIWYALTDWSLSFPYIVCFYSEIRDCLSFSQSMFPVYLSMKSLLPLLYRSTSIFKVKNSKCYVQTGKSIVNSKYLQKSTFDKLPPFYLHIRCKNIINLAIIFPIKKPINSKRVK